MESEVPLRWNHLVFTMTGGSMLGSLPFLTKGTGLLGERLTPGLGQELDAMRPKHLFASESGGPSQAY